jgi:integrase
VAKQHPHAMRHGLGFTISAAGHIPQTLAQALGHQSARTALQFYGSLAHAVAGTARKQTFSKYS